MRACGACSCSFPLPLTVNVTLRSPFGIVSFASVIGEFEEKLAAAYFQKQLVRAERRGMFETGFDPADFALGTDAWASIYGECGGNPMYLLRLSDKMYDCMGRDLKSGADLSCRILVCACCCCC